MPNVGKLFQVTLAQREGRPENIAQTVLFLIGNDFITSDCAWPWTAAIPFTRLEAETGKRGFGYGM